MPRKAHLAIAASLAALAAPVFAQDPQPLLSTSEQSSLRGKFLKFLEADDAYLEASSGKDREKANNNLIKAKDAFEKEWDRLSKKGDLVGSMADMRALFVNCFTVKRPSFSLGQLRKGAIKEFSVEYSTWVPRSYKPEVPMPTIVVLAGAKGEGWEKAQDYFESLFEKSEIANQNIIHICQLPAGSEVDVPPDYTRDNAETEEDARNSAVWRGYAETMNTLNLDRARTFLDCGKENSGFGLRFVSLFPDRFAGLVLRDPKYVEGLRLGSVSNVPVLMFKTQENAAVVDKLAAALREVNPEGVTIVDATDAYPFKASNGDVEAWMGKQRRDMTPKKVIVEPNHDRFNRAYWVDMDVATPLLLAPENQKPRLEVTADRATNRIEIKAVECESLVLYLNDDLIDLSKEFTVVVNGKAVTEQRVRSFRTMQEGLLTRRDWDYLFSVVYRTTVPSEKEQK